MKSEYENIVERLFKSWSNESVANLIPIAASGSNRKYYRLVGKSVTAIAVYNPDRKENNAFISLVDHFYKKGLSVPKIYSSDLNNNIYLQEDLGDLTLFDLLQEERSADSIPSKIIEYYKQSLSLLPKFQIEAADDLDYSVCYPRAEFDKQAMMWDLNYFKYYFIKLAGIQFDEQKLEDDFNKFTNFLLQTDTENFVYRDFQSRNIMIKDDRLFFIDFQGGRKGALQYDVASLLFSSKSNIPKELRDELLEHYLTEVNKYKKVHAEEFKKYYHGYALLRILQAMGAYGYRGFYERKDHFLKSIPYALKTLRWLVNYGDIEVKLPELFAVLNNIIDSEYLSQFTDKSDGEKLKVTIRSFSYKKGIPYDTSGNGGGFVFDCRAVHNPGRYPEYKLLTGIDEPVKEFLEKQSNVKDFLNNIFSIVDTHVKVYQSRNFKNLMINFGCTGGQHRSVYCAEALTEHLKNKFDIDIDLKHIELENNPAFTK